MIATIGRSLCLALLSVAFHLGAVENGRFGVLNLEKVFDQAKLVTNRSGELRKQSQEVQEALASRQQELNRLADEVKILPPTHPRFAEKKEAFQVKRLRFELFKERSKERIEQLEADLMKQSYKELRALLAEYAAAKNFLLIFLNPSPDLNSAQAREVRLEISLRTVVYYDDRLDITADFIAFANARYRDEGDGDAGSSSEEGAPGFERITPSEDE